MGTRRQPLRGRAGSVPSLQAIIDDFEAWKCDVRAIQTDPDDGTTYSSPEYRYEYMFCGADERWRTISADEILGTNPDGAEGGGGQKPGRYRIYVYYQDGREATEHPWEGEHFTTDSLMQSRSPADAAARLYQTVVEDSRIQIINQRSQLAQAERDLSKVRNDLRTEQALNIKLTREAAMKDLQVAASKAAEEKALAEKKAAEEELAALNESVEGLHPQIEMFVDGIVTRGAQMLGFPLPASNDTRPSGRRDQDCDPAPPGSEDVAACEKELIDIVFDIKRCRAAVEHGVISWAAVRNLQWLVTGRDPGAVPKWDEWAVEAAAAERQRGAA